MEKKISSDFPDVPVDKISHFATYDCPNFLYTITSCITPGEVNTFSYPLLVVTFQDMIVFILRLRGLILVDCQFLIIAF